MDEQTLTRLYMDLTGATESAARSVLMYILPESTRANPVEPGRGPTAAENRNQTATATAQIPARPRRLAQQAAGALGVLCLLLTLSAGDGPAARPAARAGVQPALPACA